MPGDTRVAHALVGLLIGATAGTLLSWSVVSLSLEILFCGLAAAVIGAIMGLFVGQVRLAWNRSLTQPAGAR